MEWQKIANTDQTAPSQSDLDLQFGQAYWAEHLTKM